MADERKLRLTFNSLDLNGDGELDAAELTKAFEKIGSTPSLAEVYGYIEEVGGKGKKTLNFEDFRNMLERMKNGQIATNTGVPSLIKEAFEDYIKQSNKPVEKNKPVARIGGRGKGVANENAPQGQKYVIQKKGPRIVKYNNLPEKKTLADLP
jgi:hypothetical protein